MPSATTSPSPSHLVEISDTSPGASGTSDTSPGASGTSDTSPGASGTSDTSPGAEVAALTESMSPPPVTVEPIEMSSGERGDTLKKHHPVISSSPVVSKTTDETPPSPLSLPPVQPVEWPFDTPPFVFRMYVDVQMHGGENPLLLGVQMPDTFTPKIMTEIMGNYPKMKSAIAKMDKNDTTTDKPSSDRSPQLLLAMPTLKRSRAVLMSPPPSPPPIAAVSPVPSSPPADRMIPLQPPTPDAPVKKQKHSKLTAI